MKPSNKRLGLLKLLIDRNGKAYLPVFTSLELEKYGLTLWDLSVVTWAEKAGLIEYEKSHTRAFIEITEAGEQLYAKYK